MIPSQITDINQDFQSLKTLLQIMRDDPLINDKVVTLLKMDSYQRRGILNYWLEQLRQQNEVEDLMQALSYLFDNNIAAQVFNLISNRKI